MFVASAINFELCNRRGGTVEVPDSAFNSRYERVRSRQVEDIRAAYGLCVLATR